MTSNNKILIWSGIIGLPSLLVFALVVFILIPAQAVQAKYDEDLQKASDDLLYYEASVQGFKNPQADRIAGTDCFRNTEYNVPDTQSEYNPKTKLTNFTISYMDYTKILCLGEGMKMSMTGHPSMIQKSNITNDNIEEYQRANDWTYGLLDNDIRNFLHVSNDTIVRSNGFTDITCPKNHSDVIAMANGLCKNSKELRSITP